MFTGLIEDVGEVESAVSRDGELHLTIACGRLSGADFRVGGSIACDGACLTATSAELDGAILRRFEATASAETLSRTTLGGWRRGTRVNLERPLRLGGELGGHLVSGHVDGVSRALEVRRVGDSVRVRFSSPSSVEGLIAEKGGVAADGISLTVNAVEGATFEVNVVAHTLSATSWRDLVEGDSANLEADMVARHVRALMSSRGLS